MTNLPIELWHLIFDCLELTDLSICTLVSKTLYSAVKAYRIREIAFIRRVYYWFHYTRKPARRTFKHRADFTHVSILGRSSFNFDYLRRLSIGRTSAIDLNVINQFVHLEELDIDLKNYEKKARILRLANLQMLYIFVPDHLPLVELDTPRLGKVHTFNLKRLMFVYPESIRCIHTFSHAGRLPLFRNLECLIFTDNYNIHDYSSSHECEEFEEFSLTALKKLKEIKFSYYFARYRQKNMRNFKRAIANLLTQGRSDLKVFWFSLQIRDLNLLAEYERFMENLENNLAFHFRYYEKSKDKFDFFLVPSFNSISQLSEAGFNIRSEEFVSKLLAKVSFKEINVLDPVVERELLMEIIARSPGLALLKFENSGLDQSFFDQMAEIIRLNRIPLQWLLFEDSSGGVLNYEFVTKLKDLDRFETDQQLPNELVPKLLALPMMDKIEFSSGWFTTTIERISTTRYLLNGKSLRLQELLERFDARTDSTVLGAATTMLRAFGLW